MGRDRGRESGLESVWCRGFWGKSADRGRKPRGPGTEVPLTGDATAVDRGRKCGTGGLWCCRSGRILSPVWEMGRDWGRESGLESVWCRGSWGKVRTWDGSAADRGRNDRGLGTEMWNWWPVVLQVRESTVSGPGNGSGPGTEKWPGERVVSRVQGKSADLGRNDRGPGTERPWTVFP